MGSGIFNIGANIAEGEIQSTAISTQANFQRLQNETNAKFAELQARDAKKRGRKEAQLLKSVAKQQKSAQRASAAARGVDVDAGTAADIQSDIDLASELDAIQIENNAYREAFGFKVDAQQSRFAARIAQISGDFRSRTTLITSQAAAFGSAVGVVSKASGSSFFGKE